MNFSIIVVTYNRKNNLLACLTSIKANFRPQISKVLVILNGDCSSIEKYRQVFPEFEFEYIPQTTPSSAKNYALTKICTKYVLILDKDCVLSKSYFDQINFENSFDVKSGPEITHPNAIASMKVMGMALSSPLCMGPSSVAFTKTAKLEQKVNIDQLSLGNLWFNTELFHKEEFKFNEDVFKNEEYFLLKELEKVGKKFIFNPNLYVLRINDYNLERLAKNLISSSKLRIISFIEDPSWYQSFYFVPLLFLFNLFWVVSHLNPFAISVLTIYSIIVLIYGFYKNLTFSPRLVYYHFFILFCFSIGILKGLIFSMLNYNNFKEKSSLINESKIK